MSSRKWTSSRAATAWTSGRQRLRFQVPEYNGWKISPHDFLPPSRSDHSLDGTGTDFAQIARWHEKHRCDRRMKIGIDQSHRSLVRKVRLVTYAAKYERRPQRERVLHQKTVFETRNGNGWTVPPFRLEFAGDLVHDFFQPVPAQVDTERRVLVGIRADCHVQRAEHARTFPDHPDMTVGRRIKTSGVNRELLPAIAVL